MGSERQGKDATLQLGDDVNTDDIIPARFCTTGDPESLKHHAFEHQLGAGALLARYAVIEAGDNFGCGSSREHAPLALKAAGIRVVRARSFAEIFYRNSINLGLALEYRGESRRDALADAIGAAGGLSAFNRARQAGQAQVPAVAETPPRPMTLCEQLLARASGHAHVEAGQTVFAKVDLLMSHDAVAGPAAEVFYREFGAAARVWDPARVVLVADHFIQVNRLRADAKAPRLYAAMRALAEEQGCQLIDMVGPDEAEGICHVILPERGLVRPGMLIVGTDSHTCTYGAFGALGLGIGTTDMANVLATGEVWVRVPTTILVRLDGQLPADCSAKDIMLFLLGQIGCNGAIGSVIEFQGTVVAALSMDERMTLANMAAECGAVCGMVAADGRTSQYAPLRGLDLAASSPDDGATYARTYHFDLSRLEPQVACPPRPDHVQAVSGLSDVAVSKAYIGSCTGGKLHDLGEAAAVLRGRQVAAGVTLYVVPGSQAVRQQAEQRGWMAIFEQSGAVILPTACGACINAGPGTLAAGEVGLYATSRNFRGRSGEPSAQQYLASPRIVAMSAVRGRICGRLDD